MVDHTSRERDMQPPLLQAYGLEYQRITISKLCDCRGIEFWKANKNSQMINNHRNKK